MIAYWLEFKVPSTLTHHALLLRCVTLPAAKKAIADLNDEQRDNCTLVNGSFSALQNLLALVGLYGKKWKEYDVPYEDIVCENW